MKNTLILFLTIIFILACSDDDSAPSTQLLKVTELEIVEANGNSLVNTYCLNLEDNFAVKITVATNAEGKIEPTTIDLIVNTEVLNITFTEPGSIIIPVSLTEGENIVQIISSGLTRTTFVVAPATFEIVF